jgi:hypothetical protein
MIQKTEIIKSFFMALRFNCKDYNLCIIDAQNNDFVQAIVAAPNPGAVLPMQMKPF